VVAPLAIIGPTTEGAMAGIVLFFAGDRLANELLSRFLQPNTSTSNQTPPTRKYVLVKTIAWLATIDLAIKIYVLLTSHSTLGTVDKALGFFGILGGKEIKLIVRRSGFLGHATNAVPIIAPIIVAFVAAASWRLSQGKNAIGKVTRAGLALT